MGEDHAVEVYQLEDGTYVDEFDRPVYDDGRGGFVDGDGYRVTVAVPTDDHHAEYVDEPAGHSSAAPEYVDAEDHPYREHGDAGGITTMVAEPEITVVRRKRHEPFEDLAAADGCGKRSIIALLVVILLIAGFAAYKVKGIMEVVDPPGKAGDKVASVVIPAQSTRVEVGQVLHKAGVLKDISWWEWYVRLQQPTFKAGEYVNLRKNMSYSEAIDVLDEGPKPIEQVQIRLVEGSTIAQMLGKILEKFPKYTDAMFYQALSSGAVKSKYLPNPLPAVPAGFTPWEGLLFPNTYQFDSNATPTQILQKLADAMVEKLDKYQYGAAAQKVGVTPYQTLIFASMIEREVKASDERPKVARVLYNRLARNDILGIDATTRYGQHKPTETLLQADFDPSKDPYSTRNYVVDGKVVVGGAEGRIPPTPISNPGEAAIRAAISPEAGDWLYYVVDVENPTKHVFTADPNVFIEAKKKAQAAGLL